MHFTDETIQEYYINTNKSANNESNNEDYFSNFLKLITSKDRKITPKQQIHYSEYFYKLGNINEYLRMQPIIGKDLNAENVISRLEEINEIVKNTQYVNYNEASEIKEIINYLSKNFESISKYVLGQISFEITEQIINNDELQINDEDSLLEFIIKLYEKDHQYSPLFEYVHFNNLSSEGIEKFVNVFEIEYLNNSIWKSIISRLTQKANNEKLTRKRYLIEKPIEKVEEFEYSSDKQFEGILRYLTKTTGGNIHDNGTIEITSNSINGSCHPKNLVDFENENDYDSLDEGGAIICFDFKDKLVQLTNYSMKSNCNGKKERHLKNWNIEVSNDGQNWEVIDQHKNDPTLNGSRIIGSFKIEQKNNDFYRFVRIHQTGNSWWALGNHNRFFFYCIEFYGKLKEPLNATN